MDPALLLPSPDAIPVPWGWFQALLLFTFFCHILLMNVMLGTACIALAGHFGTGGERAAESHRLAGALPFTIAFAVNFGVAPLLFVQVLYGQFVYVSSILMARFWLAVIALLIAAYAAAYLYKYRYDRLGGARPLVIGLVTLLLLTIGFVYVNNFTLMHQLPGWTRYFDQPHGVLLNLADRTLWPRYLHFMLSAPAIGGLALALYHTWRKRRGPRTRRCRSAAAAAGSPTPPCSTWSWGCGSRPCCPRGADPVHARGVVADPDDHRRHGLHHPGPGLRLSRPAGGGHGLDASPWRSWSGRAACCAPPCSPLVLAR